MAVSADLASVHTGQLVRLSSQTYAGDTHPELLLVGDAIELGCLRLGKAHRDGTGVDSTIERGMLLEPALANDD